MVSPLVTDVEFLEKFDSDEGLAWTHKAVLLVKLKIFSH